MTNDALSLFRRYNTRSHRAGTHALGSSGARSATVHEIEASLFTTITIREGIE